ncbi:MAG: Uma2 family endonuclease [Saprospiraceae bacterium]
MKDYPDIPQNQPEVVSEPIVEYNKVYTYGDYLKFEIDEMVEIIRGQIFKMSPAPRTNHQMINGNIYFRFRQKLLNYPCKIFNAPIDVVLPIENKKKNKSTTVVQPDICVICDPKIIQEKAVFGTPDFIIEIVAGKQVKKDTQIKYSVYEEAGVGEYWIVFADMRFVEVFILENGKFQRLNTFSEDDVIPVKTLSGIEISIDDIFEGL